MRIVILVSIVIQSLCATIARSPPPLPPSVPTIYVAASGVCEFDYTKASSTQTCSIGDIPLSGNTLRAGLVWSGSVRGSVDVAVSASDRAAMRVNAGQYSDNNLISVASCATQDACSPLTFTVSPHTFKDSSQPSVNLGWVVLSQTAPPAPADDSGSLWTSWKFILNYVAIAIFLLLSCAYSIPRLVGSSADDGGGGKTNDKVRYRNMKLITL